MDASTSPPPPDHITRRVQTHADPKNHPPELARIPSAHRREIIAIFYNFISAHKFPFFWVTVRGMLRNFEILVRGYPRNFRILVFWPQRFAGGAAALLASRREALAGQNPKFLKNLGVTPNLNFKISGGP